MRVEGEACAADGGLVRADGPDRVGWVRKHGRAATPEAKWGVVAWELSLGMDGNRGSFSRCREAALLHACRHGCGSTFVRYFSAELFWDVSQFHQPPAHSSIVPCRMRTAI
jgi:hypothetical protein